MQTKPSLWIVVGLAIVLAGPTMSWGALTQTFQQTGNLKLDIAGSAAGNLALVSGTLNLSQPVGSVIHKATLYAADWSNGGVPLDLTFGPTLAPGTSVGSVSPFAQDTQLGGTLYAYQWNVTSLVTGLSSFDYIIGQTSSGQQIPGVVLVVVYQDLLAPTQTVTIADGAVQVGEAPLSTDTETASFTSMPAGTTTLSIFTVSDDNAATSEVIKYNGNNVGGPIDQNLGLNASLVTNMTGTSLSGSNSLTVTSDSTGGLDHFGWILAAAVVPEPGTCMLFSLGILGLLSRRRRELNPTDAIAPH